MRLPLHAADRRLTAPRSSRLIRGKLRWVLLLAALSFVIFYWRTETHIEVQFYKRKWIKQRIVGAGSVPLSGVCFAPEHLARTSYNLTRARVTPRHVELSPGIALPFEHDCFNFAATLPRHASASWPALSEHTTLHLFWRADLKPLGQRQTALIDSLLATQDKHTTSAILWTNDAVRLLDFAADGLPLDILLKRYGDRLRVQQVDKSQLASGTPMEESSRLSLADKKAWLDGDLVRVLVLYQYGGIWVDMDSLATGRDLRVLAEHEWVTQWDCYDKPYQPLNGALMHFLRHSPYLCEMLHIMATDPLPSPSSTDWGSRLYHTLYRRLLHAGIPPFKVLPWCFADGRSCRLDARLPDPFDPQATASFHPSRMDRLARDTKNAWVIHLHNQWDKEFPKGGWIDELVLKDVAKAVVAYESLTDPTVAEDDLA